MKLLETACRAWRVQMPALVIIISLLFACNAEKQPARPSSDLRKTVADGLKALNNSQGEQARLAAYELLDSTRFTNKKERSVADIYGRIILGQSFILLDSAEKIYLPLHEAELLCIKEKNDSALTSVYNGLGMFALNFERNYAEALRYFFAGIDAAQRCSYTRMHSLILSNVASVYFLEKDPHGINYSLECYYQGKESDDSYLQYTGAVTAANHYLERGDPGIAHRFASEAETLLHHNDIKDNSVLYATLGKIMQMKGNPEEAEQYYIDALSSDQDIIWIRAYIYYADLLESEGRIQESLKLLREALSLTETGQNRLFRHEVLASLSATEGKLGNEKERQRLLAEMDKETILGADDNAASPMAHLRLKYDLERADNELARQNAELMKKNMQVATLLWGVATAVVVIILIVIMYRRKVRLHASIVRQAVEAARREASLQTAVAHLEQQLEADDDFDPSFITGPDVCDPGERTPEGKASSDTVNGCAPCTPGNQTGGLPEDSVEDNPEESPEAPVDCRDTDRIPDQRTTRLQARFEALMRNKEIYSYNMITKEKVARQLGTNRTYLSQMINNVYGISFTEFVNNLRIKEAIRMISNPDDDTPLKEIAFSLGYNSLSTFYINFKEETGMTPATFRQQVKRI